MRAISILPSPNEATIIDLQSRQRPALKAMKSTEHGIFVFDRGIRIKICINDIIMIKAASNYSHIILENRPAIFTSKNIKHWTNAFHSDRLLRIHKTFLINVEKVMEIKLSSSELILAGNHSAVFSRDMKKQLLHLYS